MAAEEGSKEVCAAAVEVEVVCAAAVEVEVADTKLPAERYKEPGQPDVAFNLLHVAGRSLVYIIAACFTAAISVLVMMLGGVLANGAIYGISLTAMFAIAHAVGVARQDPEVPWGPESTLRPRQPGLQILLWTVLALAFGTAHAVRTWCLYMHNSDGEDFGGLETMATPIGLAAYAGVATVVVVVHLGPFAILSDKRSMLGIATMMGWLLALIPGVSRLTGINPLRAIGMGVQLIAVAFVVVLILKSSKVPRAEMRNGALDSFGNMAAIQCWTLLFIANIPGAPRLARTVIVFFLQTAFTKVAKPTAELSFGKVKEWSDKPHLFAIVPSCMVAELIQCLFFIGVSFSEPRELITLLVVQAMSQFAGQLGLLLALKQSIQISVQKGIGWFKVTCLKKDAGATVDPNAMQREWQNVLYFGPMTNMTSCVAPLIIAAGLATEVAMGDLMEPAKPYSDIGMFAALLSNVSMGETIGILVMVAFLRVLLWVVESRCRAWCLLKLSTALVVGPADDDVLEWQREAPMIDKYLLSKFMISGSAKMRILMVGESILAIAVVMVQFASNIAHPIFPS